MTYSKDLRWLACRLYHERFHSVRKTAASLLLGKSTVHRWIREHPVTQKIERLHDKARQATDAIVAALRANPFHTAGSLQRHLQESHAIRLSRSTVSRCVRRSGWSRKLVSKAQLRAKDQEERDAVFTQHMRLLKASGEDWISVDETCIWTDLVPRRGYSPRGQRLFVPQRIPRQQRKKYSLLMAISRTGVVHTMVREGAIRGDDFAQFIREIPDQYRGRTIVMDNASIHKTRAVRGAMEEKGLRTLYTAPYRPDWNPIEHTFSAVKANFRNLWNHALDVHTRIRQALAMFPVQGWRNCFIAVEGRFP